MPYVYSTATASARYVEYEDDSSRSGFAKIKRQVLINGGHGVATKNLITPRGVATKVTDDELNFLMKDQNFQRHMKAGFLTVDKARVDPEKKVKDMAKGDNSAPLTPDDFKEGKHNDPESRIYSGKPKK